MTKFLVPLVIILGILLALRLSGAFDTLLVPPVSPPPVPASSPPTPASPPPTVDTTIYVPDDYSTIQAAVDAASPGDTIIVRGGSYTENVDVNKHQLTIKSQNGADSTIVQAANSNAPVFTVTADYVNMGGFMIGEGFYGIHVDTANHCNISDNNLLNNTYNGIRLDSSSSNDIRDNNVSDNDGNGIMLTDSSGNKISNNSILSNDESGIHLGNSDDNEIIDNDVTSNRVFGVYCWNSKNNKVIRNNLNSNMEGVQIWYSQDNSIYLNNFIDNGPPKEVASYDSTNIWNSPEKMTYTHNDKTWTSYLGNYWSDYGGMDTNGDGIGDAPYSIDGDEDKHPLIQPSEHYELGERGTHLFGDAIAAFTLHNYPKGPEESWEVAATFMFLISQGRYSEAEKFVCSDVLEQYYSSEYGGLEGKVKADLRGHAFEIESLVIRHESVFQTHDGTEAQVDIEYYFGDGSKGTDSLGFIQSNGSWKFQHF